VLKKYCSSVKVTLIDFEQAVIKAIEDVLVNELINNPIKLFSFESIYFKRIPRIRTCHEIQIK